MHVTLFLSRYARINTFAILGTIYETTTSGHKTATFSNRFAITAAASWKEKAFQPCGFPSSSKAILLVSMATDPPHLMAWRV